MPSFLSISECQRDVARSTGGRPRCWTSAICGLLACVGLAQSLRAEMGDEQSADKAATAPVESKADELKPLESKLGEAKTAELKTEEALGTAVALNYCRASFHRIRKSPTPDVLREEQEKILNNLNLTRLEDPEVLALYTAVLDEISQMGLTDKERVLFEKHHTGLIRRQVTWDAVAFGTDLMTAQFGSAVRTGANSWWDYRNKAFQRDIELYKIDKTRVTSVVQRSSQFLDTLWKLARKKNIPDRWLVRGDDLDALESAMQETDPAVRNRVLRRMEGFMEAYPPYWYYVARTRQELGELDDAIEIYHRLEELGRGHFRKDELLATALANQAAIEDYLGRAVARASAERALAYATDVWEANLMAARILQRHGQLDDAEDAILRNIDVGLEKSQSHVFLASLYYFSNNDKKLAALLKDPQAVAHLPASVLVRSAALLGLERTPPLVVSNLTASLEAFPRSSLGGEPLTVRVGGAWQLHLARFEAWQDGVKLPDPQVTAGQGFHDLRFISSERSSPFSLPSTPRELRIELTYPDDTKVAVTLHPGAPAERTNLAMSAPAPSLRISQVQVGPQMLALRPRDAGKAAGEPIRHETARPGLDSAGGMGFPFRKRSTELADPFTLGL